MFLRLRSCLFVALACCVSTIGFASVLNPTESVAGRSQAEWSAAYHQWLLSFPQSRTPLNDPTGELAGLRNSGPVFFLAGSLGTDPYVRDVVLTEDQFLFVPVIGVVTWDAISAYGGGLDNLRRDAAETIGISPNGSAPETVLSVQLDGTDLALPPQTRSLFDFRQRSPGLFDITFPPDAIFGLPPGVVSAVSDGWYLMFSPFAPGEYTLRFQNQTKGMGAYEGLTLNYDATYNLTVTAIPECSSMFLSGAGLLLLFWKSRSTSRLSRRRSRSECVL